MQVPEFFATVFQCVMNPLLIIVTIPVLCTAYIHYKVTSPAVMQANFWSVFIHLQKTGYSLDPTEGVYFEDLEDLISHYHKNNLPKCDAKLLRPFKKKEKV